MKLTLQKNIVIIILLSLVNHVTIAQQIIGTGGTNDCGPIGLSADIANLNCQPGGSGQFTPSTLHCEGAASLFDITHVNAVAGSTFNYYVPNEGPAPHECPASPQCGNSTSTIDMGLVNCAIGTTQADTIAFIQGIRIDKASPALADCQYVIFEPGYVLGADTDATCAAVLPVELLDFSYTLSDGSVQLDWSTGSENGADYFAIQRFNPSLSTWETLEELTAIGYSTQLVNYTFIDENPIIGESYYRLVQVDFDGTEDESEVLSVNREVTDGLVVNSIAGSKVVTVNSSVAGVKTYELISSAGETVARGEILGQFELLDFSYLLEGVYVLKLSVDGVYRSADLVALTK